MKKIVVLVKKDIYYNLKIYICAYIAIILLILFSVSGLDNSNATATLNYLVYTCIPALVFVPYSFNKDDDIGTRNFLNTLPVTLDDIVTAKFFLSLITSTIISCSALGIFHLFNENVMYRCMLIPIMASLIFSGVFIFVYYLRDLHMASYSSIIPIVFFAFAAKKIENNWRINEFDLELKWILVLIGIAFIFSVLIKKVTVTLANK